MSLMRTAFGRIALAVVVVAVCYLGARWLVRSPIERADGPSGSINVLDVYASTGDQLVTGFVFEGAGFGLRLCDERERGDPPRCARASIALVGLDPSRLDLRSAEGTDVRWSPQEVTVIGRREAGDLVVREVVR